MDSQPSSDISASSESVGDNEDTETDTESTDTATDVPPLSSGRACKIVVLDMSENLGMSLAPHPEGTQVYASNSQHPVSRARYTSLTALHAEWVAGNRTRLQRSG